MTKVKKNVTTQKLKLGQNSTTKIGTKRKEILKLWPNSKTKIVNKVNDSKCDGTHNNTYCYNSKCDKNSKILIVTKLKENF